MYVSLGLRVATVTTRTTSSCAPYIGALLAIVPASVFSFLSLHRTLQILGFVPQRLLASALLSAFVSLRCSSGLVSALHSSLLCSPRSLHSTLLCICVCSRLEARAQSSRGPLHFNQGQRRFIVTPVIGIIILSYYISDQPVSQLLGCDPLEGWLRGYSGAPQTHT